MHTNSKQNCAYCTDLPENLLESCPYCYGDPNLIFRLLTLFGLLAFSIAIVYLYA